MSSTEPPRVFAMLAGEEALTRLEDAAFVCMARFSRSLYLENSAGKLLCLGQSLLEPGPLNVLCGPWPREGALPAPGERVERRGSCLLWPQGAIELGRARLWRPLSMPFPFAPFIDPLALCAFLAERRMNAEFAPLFDVFLRGDPMPPGASPLLEAGAEALAPLADWLREPSFAPEVEGLLGLGPGLTPSGDDVLGGMMVALHACGLSGRATELYAAIRRLDGHTNAISAAHLEMASKGLGAEALHVFIGSQLAGEDLTEGVAARLDRVGHSSGWDMALGAALAVHLGRES